MSKLSVVFFGATGYLGSTIVSKLLDIPTKNFEITALVRSEEKAKKLETLGIKTVVGSYTDAPVVEDIASKADIIFSVADSDALDSMKAVLAGAKKRFDATGKKPLVIHTSGTGVFIELAGGLKKSDKIWYDDLPAEIDSQVAPTALHRDVDLIILGADKEGYVNGYIVLPSTIWGIGKNKLTEAGVANHRSIQVPALINASVSRGQAAQVGNGIAIWNAVHVDDQADLYILLFKALLEKPETVGHGSNGYYFGEAGEYTWGDLGLAIGKSMVKLGLSKSAEPTSFKDEELPTYFGSAGFGAFFGSNARARAYHSYQLGWRPKLTTWDMLQDIHVQVEAHVAATKPAAAAAPPKPTKSGLTFNTIMKKALNKH